MKTIINFKWLSVFFVSIVILGLSVSCKKKDVSTTEYENGLSAIATQFNKKCPKDEANGTKLESVTFADKTMTFRLSLSDQAITTIDLEGARDSIIHNMSEKLKKYLVKGNCGVEYKYVSPNDSSSITIVPSELESFDSDKE